MIRIPRNILKDPTVVKNELRRASKFLFETNLNVKYIEEEDLTEKDNIYINILHNFNCSFFSRQILVNNYSWAIPNKKVLYEIIKFAPKIIEVGAGTGYWAYLLKNRGCDIIACDSDRRKNKYYWFNIKKSEGCDFIEKHKDENRTLMLCWPRESLFVEKYIKTTNDNLINIIFIGEGIWGCTGDFIEKYSKAFVYEKIICIPNYNSISDFCCLATIDKTKL